MRARTKGACLLQLEPYGVQARARELSEAQAPRARPSASQKTQTRATREEQDQS